MPGLAGYVVRSQRRRFSIMVLLLALAGLFEGLGVATLLPVLQEIGTDGDSVSRLGSAATRLLGRVGLDASLAMLLVAVVVAFALKALVLYLAGIEVGRIVARVEMDLTTRLLRAIARAEWRHVAAYPRGFIAHAVSSEIGRAGSAIHMLAHASADVVLVGVYVTLALMVSWQVALAAVTAGASILFILRGGLHAIRSAGSAQVRILRAIMARITDALPSLKPLRAMGREGYLLPRLEEQLHAYYEARFRSIAASELLSRGREPILVALVALGVWVAATLTSLDAAATLVMGLLFYRTVASIAAIQQRWIAVVLGEASFRSLMEHVEAAERSPERATMYAGTAAPSVRLERELRLEDVRFAYGDAVENPVLTDANAVLRAGSFVALVGPSGSGKTTVTDLVTGLLRPSGGRVLVDGTDLAALDLSAWRRSIGYVPQESMLFNDTVAANVGLGDPTIDDEAVERALRAAGAWSFVSRRGGMAHEIGEGGGSLSGGEKRRLALARALATSPSLLVLDEPTTGLDRAAEDAVCATIASLRGELTVLVVSHQPAVLAIADELWRLEDGRVEVHTPPHVDR